MTPSSPDIDMKDSAPTPQENGSFGGIQLTVNPVADSGLGASLEPLYQVHKPPGPHQHQAHAEESCSSEQPPPGLPSQAFSTSYTAPEALSLPPQPTQPPRFQSTLPVDHINRNRGLQLTDFEQLELLKICVGFLDVLKHETKTAFYRQVSARFELQIGRSYTPTSCERTINRLTDRRREYLRTHVTGNAEGEHSEATPFIDEIIAEQDRISENTRERAEQANSQYKESQQDIEHRQFLMQGLSRARSRGRGGSRSSRSSDRRRSTTPSTASFDPEDALISSMSRLHEAIIQDDSISQRIRGLEQQYAHLQETVNENKALLQAILRNLEEGNRTRD